MLSGNTARRYTVIYECVLIVLVSCVLGYTISTGAAFTYVMGEFPAPWGNEIRAGILEALLALLFLVVMLCSVLGGARFIDIDIDESKKNLYYTLINLMTAAIMAILWTNDIFTGYVFLEILTLTSCGVLIVREIGRTTLAAIRYMIMNLLGSTVHQERPVSVPFLDAGYLRLCDADLRVGSVLPGLQMLHPAAP